MDESPPKPADSPAPTRGTPGRKPRPTAALVARMVEVLSVGGSLALAASRVRVDMSAVRSWRRIGTGRLGPSDGVPSQTLRDLCRAFVKAVDVARAEVLVKAHTRVEAAGETDWRASVALLEHERKVALARGTAEIQRLQAEKLRRELDGTLPPSRSETTITAGAVAVYLPELDPPDDAPQEPRGPAPAVE